MYGFLWEDYTCINPLQGGLSGDALKEELSGKKCSLFSFVALYKSRGLYKHTDGILGLSPKKNPKRERFYYLHSMKESQIIDHAMVSFSVAQSPYGGNQPYALFGGYNSTQIVGGSSGLKTFMNYDNWLKTWALKGEGLFYNGKAMQDPATDAPYPAIIDTGSSYLSVPPAIFEKLSEEW